MVFWCKMRHAKFGEFLAQAGDMAGREVHEENFDRAFSLEDVPRGSEVLHHMKPHKWKARGIVVKPTQYLNIMWHIIKYNEVLYVKVITMIKKVGGSLMVRLPTDAVKTKGLHEGEMVEIDVEKLRGGGFGIFRGMKPFTQEDELKSHD